MSHQDRVLTFIYLFLLSWYNRAILFNTVFHFKSWLCRFFSDFSDLKKDEATVNRWEGISLQFITKAQQTPTEQSTEAQ